MKKNDIVSALFAAAALTSSGALLAIAAAEPAKAPAVAAAAPAVVPPEVYEPQKLWGEASKDAKGFLVVENSSQVHPRANCVIVKVTNFDVKDLTQEIGRIRVAAWNSPDTYAKEGVKPYRAASFESKSAMPSSDPAQAKDATKREMRFKLCGFKDGEKVSFFAHYDQKNLGKVDKNFLGIPRDLYLFTNAKTGGVGEGLRRKGLGAPDFSDTLITVKDGQEITMKF